MRAFVAVMAVVGTVRCVSVGAAVAEFTPKVSDVTVFKDGHALVMARGTVTTTDGWCRTREVPSPVLGAFWTFVNDNQSKVDQVQAALVDAATSRPCLTIAEIVQANLGRKATIQENSGATYEGVLLGVPERARDEEEPPMPPRERSCGGRGFEVLPARPEFVLLRTMSGTKLIRHGEIRTITLTEKDPILVHAEKEKVRTVSIHVTRSGGSPDRPVEVGMIYLQKGVRWIPDYRVELLDGGKARISLQATIINELADLDNVTLRLVVGVPSFIMQETPSPMALREVNLRLSSFFSPPGRREGENRADYCSMVSNALMSQVASRMGPGRGAGGEGGAESSGPGPNIPSEGQQEDLFVYQRAGFSLKKGGRATVELMEATVPYEDIYTWAVPAFPSGENLNEGQLRMLAVAAADTGTKVMHEIRLENTTNVPWTTGPAMVFKGRLPLGQQILTYTSVRNKADLPITLAADLNTKKEEVEVSSERDVKIGSDHYTRYTLHGKLVVTNFKDKAVKLYVTRQAFGTITKASDDGKITLSNVVEDKTAGAMSKKWGWLPWWWSGVNSFSEVKWERTVEPGKTVTLEYDWYYHLRN